MTPTTNNPRLWPPVLIAFLALCAVSAAAAIPVLVHCAGYVFVGVELIQDWQLPRLVVWALGFGLTAVSFAAVLPEALNERERAKIKREIDRNKARIQHLEEIRRAKEELGI